MISIEKLIEGMIQPSIKSVKEDIYILKEGIEDVKKYFPNVPEEKFLSLVQLDPTYKGGEQLGKYGKWILGLYNKGLLKDEDFYKVTEYLITFNNNLKKISNKDIMSYKSLPDLAKVVQQFVGQKDVSNRQKTRDIKKDAVKIAEDDRWLCISPKTKEASCYYGANTKWCTAAKESNEFDNYNARGPLYIFIDKRGSGEKFQFHAESMSFMDEFDEPAIPAQVLDEKMLNLVRDKIDNAIDIDRIDMESIIPGLFMDEDGYPILEIYPMEFLSTLYSYDDETEPFFWLYENYCSNDDNIQNYDMIELEKMSDYIEKTLDGKMKSSEIYEIISKPKGFRGFCNVMKICMKETLKQLESTKSEFGFADIQLNNGDVILDITYNGSYRYYDDVVIDWWLNNNRTLYYDNIFDDIVSNSILTPMTNLKKVKDVFVENMKKLLEEINEEKKIKESILKNPSIKDIQRILNEHDIGFSFNPMKNDLTIYTNIKYLNESKDISGILSPKLVEVKSDDEEYIKKVLGNTLNKIFPNGYKILTY